jgi:CDP-glycerol glycerophosphotransferase (TagB/SpsB family)
LRRFYAIQKKEHFDAIIQDEAPFLNSKERKILYAPTWSERLSDAEFKEQLSTFLAARPPSLLLIIKLHPNQLRKYEVVLSHIQEEFASPNLFFLNNFPPIYPLLSLIDIYIGNHSSLLFDTLAFAIPTLLIDDKVPFALSIPATQLPNVFSNIDSLPCNKESMEKAYRDAYYENFSAETLKEEIKKVYSEPKDSRIGRIVT